MICPKVSILIISYNQSKFIREAIEGALLQDYKNKEIIISDDGSTDGTEEIIIEYQKKYPNLVVALLNKVNSGITVNSNIGLRKCTGKYIAFSYGDDVLLSGKISAQVKWFESNSNRVLCGHRAEIFSETDSSSYIAPKFLKKGRGAELMIKMGGIFPATSVMVRAASIPEHGFEPSIPTVTDYIMFIEVLASGGDFGYVDGIYARYRRHANNITNKRLQILADVEKTLQIVKIRYPYLEKYCNIAMSKHVNFERAIITLRSGNYRLGRQQLFEVLLNGGFGFRVLYSYISALFLEIRDLMRFVK